MEADPELLITLLAVRILSGQSRPAALDLLKALKKHLDGPRAAAYLTRRKIEVPATTKAGKPGKKQVETVELTEKGAQFLKERASAETLAAVTRAQLESLRQGLEADRHTLRTEVLATLSAKGKGKASPSPAKELGALAKAVTALAEKIDKLEAKLRNADTGGSEPILARIDQAFATLSQRLGQAFPDPSSATGPGEPPPAPTPTEPPPPLRAVLRKAYDHLCCFREYQDGLVPLPRLYHEAHQAIPTLAIAYPLQGGQRYQIVIRPHSPQVTKIQLHDIPGLIVVRQTEQSNGAWKFLIDVNFNERFTRAERLFYDVESTDGPMKGEVNLCLQPSRGKHLQFACALGIALTLQGITALVRVMANPDFSLPEALDHFQFAAHYQMLFPLSIPLAWVCMVLYDGIQYRLQN